MVLIVVHDEKGTRFGWKSRKSRTRSRTVPFHQLHFSQSIWEFTFPLFWKIESKPSQGLPYLNVLSFTFPNHLLQSGFRLSLSLDRGTLNSWLLLERYLHFQPFWSPSKPTRLFLTSTTYYDHKVSVGDSFPSFTSTYRIFSHKLFPFTVAVYSF